jgi:hypothetical protein
MFNRIATAAAILAALAVAGTASASASKSSSSISQPIVVAAGSFAPASSTVPQYGETITFNVSTTATSTPFVNLNCYQNSALVAQGWATFFDGGSAGSFGLSSPIWKSGAADCTADLGMFSNNGKWKVLASTTFHVDA